MSIQIKNTSFSDVIKKWSWSNFKKFWAEGKHEIETGKTAEEAAPLFGIKVPEQKKVLKEN